MINVHNVQLKKQFCSVQIRIIILPLSSSESYVVSMNALSGCGLRGQSRICISRCQYPMHPVSRSIALVHRLQESADKWMVVLKRATGPFRWFMTFCGRCKINIITPTVICLNSPKNDSFKFILMSEMSLLGVTQEMVDDHSSFIFPEVAHPSWPPLTNLLFYKSTAELMQTQVEGTTQC